MEWAVWAYRFTALDGIATEVVERWTLVRQYHSADAEAVDRLRELTRQRIVATLTNLKRVAEAGFSSAFDPVAWTSYRAPEPHVGRESPGMSQVVKPNTTP